MPVKRAKKSRRGRKQIDLSQAKVRAALSNGSALLLRHVDGRLPWARRLRDLVADHVSDLGGHADLSTGEASSPLPECPPVRLDGKMDADGYVPENDAWFDLLTKPDDETRRTDSNGRLRRIGRDPMTVPLDVLIAAGHPPRRTASVVAALRKALELDLSGYASTATCANTASTAPRTGPRSAAARSSTVPSGPIAWGATRTTRSVASTRLRMM